MAIDLSPELQALVQQKAAERRITPEQLIHDAVLADVQRNGVQATAKSSDPDDPEIYFAEELAAYRRMRAELERNHMGQVALFCGNELVGVFGNSDEATREGFRRFSPRKFMIQEIPEPVVEMLWGLY